MPTTYLDQSNKKKQSNNLISWNIQNDAVVSKALYLKINKCLQKKKIFQSS